MMMFTLPILAFMASRSLLFASKSDPDAWAGGVAILVTNCIVAAYCYQAFQEPDDFDKRDNDEFQPRVGAFKQRTD